MKPNKPIASFLIPAKILSEIPEETYPVIVSGDSMEPSLYTGDIVYCTKVKSSWKNIIPEGIQDGDLVYVRVTDTGKYIVKRYMNHALVSDNRSYPSWLINASFQIQGKVIKVVRKEDFITTKKEGKKWVW